MYPTAKKQFGATVSDRLAMYVYVFPKLDLYLLATVWYKILEGENFDKIVHSKNWQIIFWWMPKIKSKLQSILLLLTK